MKLEPLSTNAVWRIAQSVVELAFVYEKNQTLPKDSEKNRIEHFFKKSQGLLSENEEAWSTANTKVMDVFKVNRLYTAYSQFMTNERPEDDLKLDIWHILTYPDDPDYNNHDLALERPLPSRKQITEAGGPKEYAIKELEDHGRNSRTTLINYGKKLSKGDINFSIGRRILPFTDRVGLIEAVLDNILKLNEEEWQYVGEALLEVSKNNKSDP